MTPLPRPPAAPSRAQLFHAFQKRFLLRAHMGVLLVVVVVAGIATNFALRAFGITSMAVRYAFDVTAGYATFFLVIRVWLDYIKHEVATDPTWPRKIREAPADDPRALRRTSSASSEDECTVGRAALDVASDAPGCLFEGVEGGLFIGAVALLLALAGGAFLLFESAPLILSEAAFETLLAFSLWKPIKRLESPAWPSSILATTAPYFLGCLVLAVILGFTLAAYCPGATTISEAWTCGSR